MSKNNERVVSIFQETNVFDNTRNDDEVDIYYDRAILQIKYIALKDYGDNIMDNIGAIFMKLDKEEKQAFLRHAFNALKNRDQEMVMCETAPNSIKEELSMMEVNNQKDMRIFKMFFFKVASIFLGLITTLVIILTFEPQIPWIKEFTNIIKEIKGA
jgi:hypothetical protein